MFRFKNKCLGKAGKGGPRWNKIRLGKSYLQFELSEFFSTATILNFLSWTNKVH